MEFKRINDIAENWRSVTQKVIELRNPSLIELRRLFKDTYELIEEYSRNDIVPKGICEVLIEMHEFGWWVSDLDHTPIHYLYQEIISLINKLNKYFLTRDANTSEIKRLMERITLIYKNNK